jgi:hypothetical protein
MILTHTYFFLQQLPQFSEQLPLCYIIKAEDQS